MAGRLFGSSCPYLSGCGAPGGVVIVEGVFAIANDDVSQRTRIDKFDQRRGMQSWRKPIWRVEGRRRDLENSDKAAAGSWQKAVDIETISPTTEGR